MVTEKALKEIEALNDKIVKLEEAEADARQKMFNSKDPFLVKAYRKEMNKCNDQKYKAKDKLQEIEGFGIASSEMTKLKKELYDFKTLERNTSIGITSYTSAGFSKTLQSHVVIDYTKYSGFMRNVKGCSSLANTKHIHSLEFISEEKYKELISQKASPAL
jgi:hypothetical protein